MAAAPPPLAGPDFVRALQDANQTANSEGILKIQNKLVRWLGYQEFVPREVAAPVPGAPADEGTVEELVVEWGGGPAAAPAGGTVTFNAMPGKVIDFDGLTAPPKNPSTPFKIDLSDPRVVVLFGLMSTRDNWSRLYEQRRQLLVERANFPAILTQADANAKRDQIINDPSLRALNPSIMPPILILDRLAEIKKVEGDVPKNISSRAKTPWKYDTLQAQIRRELAAIKTAVGSVITLPSPSVYIEKDGKFVSRNQLKSEDLGGSTPGAWGYVSDVVKSTLGFIRRRVEASELPYMQRASTPDERMTNQKLRDMIIAGRFPYDPSDPGRAVPYLYKGREPVQLDLLKSQRIEKKMEEQGGLSCSPLFTQDEVEQYTSSGMNIARQALPFGAPLGSTGDIGRFLAPNNEARGFIDRGVPAPGERDPRTGVPAPPAAPAVPAVPVAPPEGSRRLFMNSCANTRACPGRLDCRMISDY